METRKHIASEKLQSGTHNCAQAIVSTYADIIGLDETTAKNIANAFGGGMGNMEGTCGALVGVGIVLGWNEASHDAVPREERRNPMQVAERCWYKHRVARVFRLCSRCGGITGRAIGQIKLLFVKIIIFSSLLLLQAIHHT